MNAKLYLETVMKMNYFTIANMQLDRRDWLFPSDPAVFATNPMNVAHGAAGVMYGLLRTGGEIPQQALSWMLSQEMTNDDYPPGLYVGLAGIAWVFWELGLKEEALKLMNQAERHPLLWQAPNLYSGVSGYGIACLRFYLNTGDVIWLERAAIAGEWLLNRNDDESLTKNYCIESRGETYLGYAKGNSGVALFLLYLYQITGEKKFYESGEAALRFDLSYLQETEEGYISVPRGEIASPERVFTHYWLDGSAGICSVLWRYWAVSGRHEHYALATALMTDTFRKFTVFPGLFKGSAGLGNVLLDAYRLTGNRGYLDRARDIGQGILLFQLKRDDGIAFPGEQLFRISTDFGTGMAGISLFLQRLAKSGEEDNFQFMLDPLLNHTAKRIEGVKSHE